MNSHHVIERILRHTIGLDPSSIGSPAIARAFRARMQAHGIDSPEEYGALLQRSPDEMQELIESVVVSETWFFRDDAPFSTLTEVVKNEWLPAHPNSTLRILSVPCASGEEPYSIAMALMDSGLPASRFCIDATDVSLRVLDHARRGVYGRNSFRSSNLEFRDRYFLRVEDGFLLSEIVRKRIDFRQGNLLAHHFASGEGLYDFIFCRNVLIYFDDDAQDRAIAGLRRLLTADGMLFVGHAEIPLLTRRGFVASDFPRAFACRKKSASPVRPAKRRVPEKRPHSVHRIVRPVQPLLQPQARQQSRQIIPSGPVPQAENKSDLERAADLADRGRLQEAAELCISHLRSHADSARAHYLLGLTRDAAGEEKQAMEQYRRALYLDPNHAESLAHLASLLEKQGDDAMAGRLYARARRVHQSTTTNRS